MKHNTTNPSLAYSKLNTVLLILLLVLAIGVLYVTAQQNKNDVEDTTPMAEQSGYVSGEVTLPGENF